MSFNALITFVWDFNCQLHLVTLGSIHTWCHQKQNICTYLEGSQEKKSVKKYCILHLAKYHFYSPNPKCLFVAVNSSVVPPAAAVRVEQPREDEEVEAAEEAKVEAAFEEVPRPRIGFCSVLRSEKLSEVLIKLDKLSKLTDPLIT